MLLLLGRNRELRIASAGMGSTGGGTATGQGSWRPSRALAWPCKRRDRAESQPATTSPPCPRAGRQPQYQAQARAQHHTVHPHVAGSASTEGWEPPSAPRHGHTPGAPHTGREKQEGAVLQPGGPQWCRAGSLGPCSGEPALPTALSKSRFVLLGVHWEFKLQPHEPSRGWHVPTVTGCRAPSILCAWRAGGPKHTAGGLRGLSLACTPQRGPWLGAKQRCRGWTCWCMGQGHARRLCTVPWALPSQGRAAPAPPGRVPLPSARGFCGHSRRRRSKVPVQGGVGRGNALHLTLGTETSQELIPSVVLT